MEIMIKELLQRYFLNLLAIIGITILWVGIWDGIGNLGPMENPLVSFFVGAALLAISPLIFKKAQPLPLWEEHETIKDLVEKIQNHPKKYQFHIKYKDQRQKKETMLNAKNLHRIEKNFLIFVENNQEKFLPIHRITSFLYKGQPWNPKK